MNPALMGPTAAAVLLAMTPAPGLAQESNAAAERARLAEQRIQAEAARRLEEEQASVPAALPATEPALERAPAPVTAAPRTAPAQPAEPSRSVRAEAPADLSLALEQLRTLGELKDSGYVDDEEFERIKQRILDANL